MSRNGSCSRLGCLLDTLPSAPTLNEVASLYLRRNGRRETVYAQIPATSSRKPTFTPPKVLRQLAEIRHFNLFVTTAFDPLLEAAIIDVASAVKMALRDRLSPETTGATSKQPPGSLERVRPFITSLDGFGLARRSRSPTRTLLEFLYALQSESLTVP